MKELPTTSFDWSFKIVVKKDLMGPAKKSKSVNKRFSYGNEIPPTKDGDNSYKKNQRKKKLSDMLGPHWSKDELEHFYEAYRKHGRDWRKVAAVLRNRSMEMVESVYSLNKAYLSLPEGTASVAGFIAMMTDYYSNMEDRDSEQEKNDGVGTSRKPQKRLQGKVHETVPKGAVDRLNLHPGAVSSDYGFMSLLKKKRSGGSRPRVVGKRTPRFPVSHTYENVKGEKSFLPSRKGVKLRADNDEDVAHSIAMALAEASKRGSSPNRRPSSMMSSPTQSAERMDDESDVGSGYGEDIEGSMEADNTDFSRDKNKERLNAGYMLHDRKGSQGKKIRIDKKENKHLDYIREACSGTEGHNLGTIRRNFEVADAKPLKSSQGSKKKSKGPRIDRDENSAFDALETLANLSLMILPEANRNGKDELIDDSHLLLSKPSNRQGEKRKSSIPKANRSISRLESADKKPQTSNKDLVNDTNIASEPKDSHHLITKVSRKRQKIVAPKISKAEGKSAKESLGAEATDAIQMSLKNDENAPSSSHSRKEVTKVRSKHKLFKTDTLKKHQTPVKLSGSLSNKLMRRWCACEFFYSAMDHPWFAKQEFVEYLYHVGLGHVPRLTRVEWGVIRSSLGKPRRFSSNFLKEEKEKLNQYQDSVRTHYTELRSGNRDGLPTDLARPLSVGQRVIAVYPKTREIHDGTVLTVDHDRCRVQFDRPDLGVEKIMDTDCMPLNPFENMPASMMRGKFLESLNEVNMNGLVKDQRLESYLKSTSREHLENTNDASIMSDFLESRSGLLNHHAKEADVEAIAELTRALDKKEAVVLELRRMNDDVLENQTDGDCSLQDSEAFKKQYAAVLVQLNEANAQVSSALFRLRQRNTYQSNFNLSLPMTAGISHDSKSQVNQIAEISRTKARTMVDIAIQAMSSLKLDHTVEIDKAVDYVNDRLPLDDSFVTVKAPDSNPIKSLNKASVPSELITQCVATLFIIQKCTERQFPPAEVASILDSAVSSLQPWSPQNVQVYAEIQKCMGIIKNQILALVPT
ncbi:hypothetical protein L1887_00118 [Cichorium endivia]|nr:hypothetical protein L1887_00118 [Cichorium endivia]